MEKLHYIAVFVLVAAFVGIALVYPGAPQQAPTGAAVVGGNDVLVPEKITIGMSSVQPLNGLLTVAYEKGFFAEEGLDVEAVEFNSGKEALQAFLGGSLDVSVSGEVPVMFSSLAGNKFSIVSQLVEKTNGDIRVIALKDGNLNDQKAYFTAKKRKLATSFGGGPEFYTYNFLKKYGIEDVELVNMKPADMPAAIISGSVDAIAVFEPFAYKAEKELGSKAIAFEDASVYSEMFVLVAHTDWANSHQDTVENIVDALEKAGDFIETNPAEAKAIIGEHTKLDAATLDGIWDKYVFRPALTKTLVDYLTAEAKWAVETGKVNATAVPDFNSYVYAEGFGGVAG